MDYIVFDLEWNQNPDHRRRPNMMLPFEILEIGAVKLDEELRETDTFHRLIKPAIYHRIDDSIRRVTHMDMRELKHGIPFPDAAEEFISWCGEDFRFCTWARQDVMELQRNMRYYHMLDLLPGPVVYYDVQKLASLTFEDGKERRSLEHMVDFLELSKDKNFHRALADAVYTARVFAHVNRRYLIGYESIDSYQNPKEKWEEFIYTSGDREKYITREFGNRDRLVHDKGVHRMRCPVCKKFTKSAHWTAINSKVYLCLTACAEHGSVEGRLRIRKTDQDRYYAERTLRLITQDEEKELRARLEALQ
ncbi:MAG: exonuclease domain-containing protein [Blautia sp.]|nr:exonuclease domain-containing protein [Blautia sp.]